MVIRMTKDSSIPLVERGKTFTVDSVSRGDNGKKFYYIHHIGNYFAIPEDACEVVPLGSVCEAIREVAKP